MNLSLLLLIISIVIAQPFNINMDFDKNGFNINNIYIKYNSWYEGNITNNYAINFDSINSDNYDNNKYVLTSMYNSNIYFETTNVYYNSNNSIKVILLIMNYQFQDVNNDFILNLVFNKILYEFTIPCGPINFNEKHYLQIDDFNIEFSNKVLIDNNNHVMHLERFGNYFYLHFPSFKEYILYEFNIFPNIINNIM
jgi:hypothetical protein